MIIRRVIGENEIVDEGFDVIIIEVRDGVEKEGEPEFESEVQARK